MTDSLSEKFMSIKNKEDCQIEREKENKKKHLNLFQDDKSQYVNTLEPKYRNVDVTEVELPETDVNSMANSDVERENENANMLLDVRILRKEIVEIGAFTRNRILFVA